MKSEAEFCTVVKNSLINGFKIPDATGMFASSIQRCFDGIGSIKVDDKLKFVCWEAKFMKSLGAFSLKVVEPHQDAYLRAYQQCENIQTFVILGIDIDRTDKRAYVFDWNELYPLYEVGFSFHKKFLDNLPYNPIKKGKFEFNNIINKEDIKKVYSKSIEVIIEESKLKNKELKTGLQI